MGDLLIAGAIASNVAIAVLVAAWLAQAHAYRERETMSGAMNVARLVSEELSARLDRADVALSTVADEFQRQLDAGQPDPTTVNAFIVRIASREPDLLALHIVDQQGTVRYGTPAADAPLDVPRRPLRREPLAEGEARPVDPEPILERAGDRPVLFLSRRVSRGDGSSAAIVRGSIEPSRISRLLARVDAGPHGIITLRWADMTLVASSRQNESALGSRKVSGALEAHLAAGHESGTYEAVSSLDGTTRLCAFTKLRNAPMYVVVGVGHGDTMASWWRQAAAVSSLFGCLVLATVIGALHARRALLRWAQAEVDHEKLRAQLFQAQKLEGIGQLAGGVAHDVNNLVTVVLSCGQTLREELRAGASADPEAVDQIVMAGERARDLTRRLLTFARKQEVSPVCLDLNLVVRDSELLLRRALRPSVSIALDLEEGLWPVWCDPVQVDQVLMNLAVNASDAMPDGGTLTIQTRNVHVAPPPDAMGIPAGPCVQLTVTDTGLGLSEEAREHLFEPFFTTKPPGCGTGLGLATVHGIVRQAGGRVEVESEAGRGTSFRIYFPRTSRMAERRASS